MNNISIDVVNKQRDVVAKFNKSKVPHYHLNTPFRHGATMDYVWASMGLRNSTFGETAEIPKNFDHDIVFFLDIDALPLNDWVIDYFIEKAARGVLIGNIQRSNHIENNQHVFVAPSAVALSQSTYLTLGKPSALETKRADVGEEYTFAAEESGIVPIEFLMPLKFDAAPAECPSWALKDGMPVYGRGTTFGFEGRGTGVGSNVVVGEMPMIWHNFQSFHPGQQERFMAKCEELLNG